MLEQFEEQMYAQKDVRQIIVHIERIEIIRRENY